MSKVTEQIKSEKFLEGIGFYTLEDDKRFWQNDENIFKFCVYSDLTKVVRIKDDTLIEEFKNDLRTLIGFVVCNKVVDNQLIVKVAGDIDDFVEKERIRKNFEDCKTLLFDLGYTKDKFDLLPAVWYRSEKSTKMSVIIAPDYVKLIMADSIFFILGNDFIYRGDDLFVVLLGALVANKQIGIVDLENIKNPNSPYNTRCKI